MSGHNDHVQQNQIKNLQQRQHPYIDWLSSELNKWTKIKYNMPISHMNNMLNDL